MTLARGTSGERVLFFGDYFEATGGLASGNRHFDRFSSCPPQMLSNPWPPAFSKTWEQLLNPETNRVQRSRGPFFIPHPVFTSEVLSSPPVGQHLPTREDATVRRAWPTSKLS